jgi:protein-S-isoprenylcysteine O-methyltransferase Ste14
MNAPHPAVSPPARLPWPPLLMAATVAVGLGLGSIAGDATGSLLAGVIFQAAGGGLVAAALALDIWCARTLARQETTILPHRAASSLVTEGPYRFSRNPIYIAHVTLVLAVGLILAAPFIVALTPLLALGLQKLAIEPEERHLREQFGVDFDAYVARTPRWL